MTQIEFSYQVVCQTAPLKGFARKLTKNEEASKDLLQDTFLKAFQYQNKFASGTNMKAWLGAIMRNTFINERKKMSYISGLNIDISDIHSGKMVLPTVVNLGPNTILQNEIRLAMNTLDDGVRAPFELSQQGFRYDEIADTLKLSPGTVKARIFTARKQLQLLLFHYRIDNSMLN